MSLTYSKIKNMAPGTTLTLKYPDYEGKPVQHYATLASTGNWDIYNLTVGYVSTVSTVTIATYSPTPAGLTLPDVRNLPYRSIVYIDGYTKISDRYAIKTYKGWDVYYEYDDKFVNTYTDSDIAEFHVYQMVDLGVDHCTTRSVSLPKGTHRYGHTVVAAIRTPVRSGEWRFMTAEGTYLETPTSTTTVDVRDLIQSDDADDDTNGGVIYVIRTVSGAEYRFSAEEFDNMPEDAVEGTTLDGIFICIKRQYIESVAGIPA